MAAPGEYSDALRALGQFLDQVGATSVEIHSDIGEWSVTWDTTNETQLQPFHLHALRTVASLRRGTRGTSRILNLAAALRTLGEMLDETHAAGFRISVAAGGFEVWATVGGLEGGRVFTIAELEKLAREQQARRSA